MYLLDTDILSNLMRRRPSESLIARLAQVDPQHQFTSSVTLGELVYGAYRTGEPAGVFLDRFRQILLPNLAVLPFDASAAWRYGEVRAALERRGSPIGDADLRIAAIALSRELTMVTTNVRHFERVPGLRVENWLV